MSPYNIPEALLILAHPSFGMGRMILWIGVRKRNRRQGCLPPYSFPCSAVNEPAPPLLSIRWKDVNLRITNNYPNNLRTESCSVFFFFLNNSFYKLRIEIWRSLNLRVVDLSLRFFKLIFKQLLRKGNVYS